MIEGKKPYNKGGYEERASHVDREQEFAEPSMREEQQKSPEPRTPARICS